MSTPPPFAPRVHALAGGVLAPLAAGAAPGLAAILAQLTPWRELGFTTEGLAAYLTRPDPGLHRFQLTRAGGVAGLVCVRYPWLRGPYIELIALFPGHQGAGLGGAIIAWPTQQVPTANSLWALVSAFNEPARAFYARQGFIEIAPLPDLVTPGFQEILLRKFVAGPSVKGRKKP